MLGTMGEVQSRPRPSSSDLSEAIDLLKAAGGKDKRAEKMLQKMFDVQKHNEKIIDEARALKREAESASKKAHVTIEEASQLQAQVRIAQEKLRSDTEKSRKVLDEQGNDLVSSRLSLNADKMVFDKKMNLVNSDLAKANNKLVSRESRLSQHETECALLKKTLDEVLAEFTKIGERFALAATRARQI